MATSRSLGELAARISSDRTAVFGSSRAVAASTTSLCAPELVGSPLRICSAILQRLGRVFAQGHVAFGDAAADEPALLSIFLKKPLPLPAFLHLRRPQRLAAFIQAGLLGQHSD